jgi:hypothetical protein
MVDIQTQIESNAPEDSQFKNVCITLAVIGCIFAVLGGILTILAVGPLTARIGFSILVIGFVLVSIAELLSYFLMAKRSRPMRRMKLGSGNITNKTQVALGATVLLLSTFSMIAYYFVLTPSVEFPGFYTNSDTFGLPEFFIFLQLFVGITILFHSFVRARFLELVIGMIVFVWTPITCMVFSSRLHPSGIQTPYFPLNDIILTCLAMMLDVFLGIALILDGKGKFHWK